MGTALLLQSRSSELFAVDIHPAATIGDGVMLDHASGIVIGSTAILGDDIYMLHSTTLGATGRPMGKRKRHPTIGSSCTIGAGCTILGDITVGDSATVGAAAVVTRPIPDGGTVIGVNHLLKRKDQTAGGEAEGGDEPTDGRCVGAAPVVHLPKRAAGFVAEGEGGEAAPPLWCEQPTGETGGATYGAGRLGFGGERPSEPPIKRADSHTWFYHRETSETVEEGSYDMFGV